MTGTPLDRGAPPAPRGAQPLRNTRTLQAQAAGGLHFTVHAASPGHDALAISRDDGLRITIPMAPGALAALHQLLGDALGLPTTKEGGR
jgi:hypothetical protein